MRRQAAHSLKSAFRCKYTHIKQTKQGFHGQKVCPTARKITFCSRISKSYNPAFRGLCRILTAGFRLTTRAFTRRKHGIQNGWTRHLRLPDGAVRKGRRFYDVIKGMKSHNESGRPGSHMPGLPLSLCGVSHCRTRGFTVRRGLFRRLAHRELECLAVP